MAVNSVSRTLRRVPLDLRLVIERLQRLLVNPRVLGGMKTVVAGLLGDH